MSLFQLVNEFRPLFRMLDETVGQSSGMRSNNLLGDPFIEGFSRTRSLQPLMQLSEEGSNYVVEAELPGVQKENVNISVSNGGRSITIEGKVLRRPRETERSVPATETNNAVANSNQDQESKTVTTTEPYSVGEAAFRRTFWLPRPADASKVVATMKDGLLNLTIPKAEESGTVKVTIQ